MGKDFSVSFCLQITCLMQFGCGMYRSFVWQRCYCNPNQSKVCSANTFLFPCSSVRDAKPEYQPPVLIFVRLFYFIFGVVMLLFDATFWERQMYYKSTMAKHNFAVFVFFFPFAVLFGIQIYYIHTEIYSPKRRERSFHWQSGIRSTVAEGEESQSNVA